ncbi:hypothetical protein F3Y22_tig00112762pilonHSYRG00092 [Hibiscus syriacus]|uniref:Uncharacterized protein n=1 Tax=Hibiscus syriacus TaxID=106335 RepID=A0A6A2XR68_HIBSY|nr:hypothetical protein F3Y22_tig00112762pilonHSYRG00092 [Hibiscus syriacus]
MVLDTTAGVLGIALGSQTDEECSGWIDLCALLTFLLGFAAAVLVVLAQVCGNCFAGCVCICTKDELNKASANDWRPLPTFFHVGLTMLIIGMANADSKSNPFFTVGGILCFAHGLFTVAYHLRPKCLMLEFQNERHLWWVNFLYLCRIFHPCRGLWIICGRKLRMVSSSGVPLSMDAFTSSKKRLEYAKVCIEIGVGDVIPKYVDLVLKDGLVVSICNKRGKEIISPEHSSVFFPPLHREAGIR